MMKKLLALLLLLPALASAATNAYNIGDSTNITGGSFTNSTLTGTTTLPGLNASSLVLTNASRALSSYSGSSCTNQAIYSLSVSAVASCTSTFVGGGHTAMTALGLRSTGTGAFDLTLANTENLTAGRTLTLKVNNAARTVDLGGNLTLAAALTTSGANALTLTTTGATNVTLPTTGTLATLAGAEALTNKTINGNTWTAGTGTLTIAAGKTFTASNTLTLAGTDSSTLNVGTGGTLGTAAYTAASAYAPAAGSTSIVTLGTVTTGTWTATAIAPTRGGTGQSTTATSGRYLKGDGTNWGTSSGSASGTGACSANTWASTLNSDAAPTCTQPSISAGVSGLGTGVATALAVNVGAAGAPVVLNGALGTPSSGTLTNATGLPVSTGISGLGTGIAAFLAAGPYAEGQTTAISMTCGTSGTITLNGTGNKWTYTRVGRLVTATGRFTVASVSSPVGLLSITGLPYTSIATTGSGTAAAVRASGLAATATTAIQGVLGESSTSVIVKKFAAGAESDVCGDIQAGSEIDVGVTYHAQ